MRDAIRVSLDRIGLGMSTCVLLLFVTACAPHIIKFDPPQGNVGTLVTIEGERFGATVAENTVKFQGVAVPPTDITSASKTKITAKVPAGATTGLISVTTSKGTGYSDVNFVVPSPPKWTFMVYLDADNNLESAGLDDFIEMAAVGSSAALNIVVQMDRTPASNSSYGYSSAYGNWASTRRFLIAKNSNPSATPIQDLGEQNMGDPTVLRDFVEWAITNYPAEHYALVIWNHGGGWRFLMDRLAEKVRASRSRGGADWGVTRTVASDETDGDELYMSEVQTALEAAKARLEGRLNTSVKLDVLGFDACLMGMVEVAYAVRNVTSYVVGSEETEPGPGWPYDTVLADVAANPSIAPKDLASTIVTRYGASYSSGVTQSAVDIAALNGLVQRIDSFASAANAEWATLKAVRASTRQYHYDNLQTTWGADLCDFADRVYSQVSSAALKNAAMDVKTAVQSFVIKEHHSSNMAGSNGVAIYFPPTNAEYSADPEHTGYEQNNTFMVVQFVRDHLWDNWLTTYNSSIPP
jgi:hypothetical protein